MPFADNLKSLAPVDTLDRIELHDTTGAIVARIENKPGQQGSLAVYQHLLASHGRIDVAAAREGLQLYAEHTDDARRNAGKHPNIDRLLTVEATGVALTGKIFRRE
jgi:hypothetical protein